MKIRCKNCGEIIDGQTRKGHLVWCSCQKCAIDETDYYCRLLGNPKDYEEIMDRKEEGENN